MRGPTPGDTIYIPETGQLQQSASTDQPSHLFSFHIIILFNYGLREMIHDERTTLEIWNKEEFMNINKCLLKGQTEKLNSDG